VTLGDIHHVRSKLIRYVAADRGGDEHLFESIDGVSKTGAPRFIEFRKDVIEDEHRIARGRFATKDGGRRKFERERERPRLPMTRISARRKIIQSENQIVAMRPHKGDAAVEF
jgi:hypothetical protein